MLWVKKMEPASETVRQASPTEAAAWVTASRPNGFSSYVRGSRVTIAVPRLGHCGGVHPLFTGSRDGVHVGVVGASIAFRNVALVDPEPPPGSAGGESPRTRLRPPIHSPPRVDRAPDGLEMAVGTMQPMEQTDGARTDGADVAPGAGPAQADP